jgi:MFS family permease
MTTTAARRAGPSSAARPPLITRPLLLRFVSVAGSSVSFYLPLAVVPVYAKASGSDVGSGLANGALLLATVAAELATPRLVIALGYRLSLTIGLVLLGAPALALLGPARLAVIVAVSILRGVGFAITTVAGGALTASLIPAERRGEGLGVAGLVSGVPALVCLPAGVWISARYGFAPVFAATAVAALLPLGSMPGLPARRAAVQRTGGVLRLLRTRAMARPAAIFCAATMGVGVLVTFLPLALTARSAAVATAALFAQPAASTAARWTAGRIGDRYGQHRLLCPGIVLSAVGLAAIAVTGSPGLVVGGAACFGTGFGLLQNATLAVLFGSAGRHGYEGASAIWNAAYDGGMGAGAIGIGILAAHAGYSIAFLATGLLLPFALIPARAEHALPGRQPGPANLDCQNGG